MKTYERAFTEDVRVTEMFNVPTTYTEEGYPTTDGLEETIFKEPKLRALIESFTELPEVEGNDMLHRVTMAPFWKEFGRPVFTITPELAAALIMTELPDGEPTHSPFPAFVVSIQVKPGDPTPLVIDGRDYYGFGFFGQAKAWCLWAFPRTEPEHSHYEKLPATVPLSQWTEEHQQSVHIHRLLANFLAYIAAKKIAGDLPSMTSPRLGSRKGTKVCALGRDVQLPRNLIYAARGEGKARDEYKINKRYVVRGHWRNQRYGPRTQSKTKRIWILPFWKGPDVLEAAERTYSVK